MGRKPNILIPTLLIALAIPLTIFSVFQQQDNRSKASTNMTPNAGRPFADDSAWNQPIGTNVQLDPKSAEMVQTLAGGDKVADLYEFGTPIYFADANTPKYNINCTESWGTCGISTEQVPIPDDAKQAPGSDGQMVIVDLSSRKSYEFWVYKNDKATTNWGGILPLDGDGRGSPENSAIGAGTSRLAGIVRTYEMQQGNIEHALVFSSSYCAVDEIRFPAVKTDGKYSGAGAIPEGARIQLDPSVNVDSLSMSAGEKTVAKALQKYGAYVIDCGGAGMAFQFEHPMDKPDPYPSVGFTSDYYQMNGIPWEKLRVLKEWNSYTPVAGGVQPSTGTQITTAPSLITPTIYCVGGVGEPPCAPINPSTSAAPSGGATNPSTVPSGGVNPSGGASTPYPSINPCQESTSSVMHNKKKHKKHKHGRGGGFIERFMKFLIWLIEYILRGGNVPLPTDPGNPSPCPEPTNAVEPTTVPTTGAQPTQDPTPTLFGTSPTPSTNPSTAPTAGQKIYGATGVVGYGAAARAKSLLGVNGTRDCLGEVNIEDANGGLPALAAQGMHLSLCVNDGEGLSSLDKHRQDYANKMAEAVKKYGPGGTYFANKPDQAQYAVESFSGMNEPYGNWFRGGDIDPASYGRIMKDAIIAGHAANPNAKIYVALDPDSNTWQEQVLAAVPDLYELADGFEIHLYFTPSEMASVLDEKKAWAWSKPGGNGKPFIITEMNLTDQRASSEQEYISAMPEFVKIAKDRPWVKEIHMFTMNGYSGRDYLGFITESGTVNQARSDAYKSAIQQALGSQ